MLEASTKKLQKQIEDLEVSVYIQVYGVKVKREFLHRVLKKQVWLTWTSM